MILENHGIVDAPTVHTAHILEIHLAGLVDETSPGRAHQEPTASWTCRKSSSSALFESRGRCSPVNRPSDAALGHKTMLDL